MSISELFKKYLGKKEELDEPEIPLDWVNQKQEPESEQEDAVWPPVEVKKRKRFVLGEKKIKGAKAMFFIYVLLAIGTIRVSPWILVLFVPTILLIMDYIRCNETLKKLGAWAEVEENDLNNSSSVK